MTTIKTHNNTIIIGPTQYKYLNTTQQSNHTTHFSDPNLQQLLNTHFN